MPNHQYTAEQALEVLMKKIKIQDENLAAEVQAAIDAGKDVSEYEPSTDRRKKARQYRKTVAFTHEEALKVAVNALNAFFVEQPFFIDSAADSLEQTAIGLPRHKYKVWEVSPEGAAGEPEPLELSGKDEEKPVEIEMQTVTQISKSAEETISLNRIPAKQIQEQSRQMDRLRFLTDFGKV